MIIKRIVIHHSADKGNFYQIQSYYRSINKRFPYHWYIGKDGFIYKGIYQDNKRGSHVGGKNTGSLGICLEGELHLENPTEEQLWALDNLIQFILNNPHKDYRIEEIKPHNYYNDTICCGKWLSDYVNKYYNLGENDGI